MAKSSQQEWKKYGIIVVLLVLFVVVSRVLPHPPNVAPVAAVAIFAGVLLPRRWALSLPLAAMIVSDLFIGLHDVVAFTWGSFVLIALLSHKFARGNYTPLTVLSSSLGASTLFFVVTNFGVWLMSGMYTRTFTGLLESYYMAIPFFRNTLIGDLAYVTIFYLIFLTVKQWVPLSPQLSRQQADALE